MNAIDRLIEYWDNEDKYLPMIDHAEQYFPDRDENDDVNIGWDCGFIDNRPYFLECWAMSGITMITVFLSTIGIEDYTIADLEDLLIDKANIYSKREGYESPNVIVITDGNGNDFFSINIVVGLEEEPARINGGGNLLSFSALNELNDF